jgi:hypothetical protein
MNEEECKQASPIGTMPEDVFMERQNKHRIIALIDAIGRYSSTEKPVPPDWVSELRERILRVWGER